MNLSKIFSIIGRPKEPPIDDANESIVQDQKAYVEQERQKWLKNYNTTALEDFLAKRKHELLEEAISFSSRTERLDECGILAARKLVQMSTLNEIQNYVRTGKIE
jgi:hypothetical protein